MIFSGGPIGWATDPFTLCPDAISGAVCSASFFLFAASMYFMAIRGVDQSNMAISCASVTSGSQDSPDFAGRAEIVHQDRGCGGVHVFAFELSSGFGQYAPHDCPTFTRGVSKRRRTISGCDRRDPGQCDSFHRFRYTRATRCRSDGALRAPPKT
jgi:hypothetical protein